MSTEGNAAPAPPLADRTGASDRRFWHREDWLAVVFGLGIVAVAYGLFAGGSSLAWLAVTPAKWSTIRRMPKFGLT